MAKRAVQSAPACPEYFFAKELSGENPPSLAQLRELYGLAMDIAEQRPWERIGDDQLILVRDPVSGEVCHCCVTGALGEVFAVHVYIGPESYRLYRRVASGAVKDSAEFLVRQHGVYVEFVSRSELARQDKELLDCLGHSKAKEMPSPMFRAMRPGFHPWFVTAEEAETLAECMRAVLVVCSLDSSGSRASFWGRAGRFPMVKPVSDEDGRFLIVEETIAVSDEPPLAPARLDERSAEILRKHDYPIRGVVELDFVHTHGSVGGKNERKACVSVALAVDPNTGLVLCAEATESTVPAGDALGKAFASAVRGMRAIPEQVRVRSARWRDSLVPVLAPFGVGIEVSPRMRATDEARAHLIEFMGRGF